MSWEKFLKGYKKSSDKDSWGKVYIAKNTNKMLIANWNRNFPLILKNMTNFFSLKKFFVNFFPFILPSRFKLYGTYFFTGSHKTKKIETKMKFVSN